jgi:hypothetical protein
VGFCELDNGLASCDDPALARRLASRLGAGQLLGYLEKWLDRLPSMLTEEDRRRRYRYRFSLRQLEVSDTAVFDRPATGRAWFEAVIKEHLDLGRPEQVRLLFDRRIVSSGRRPTPGRFATTLIRKGIDPHIQVHYRASKVKAYFKESRALRVETTINNPDDFGVKRTLCQDNWQALVRHGRMTNARFLAALGEDAPAPPDVATLESVVMPSIDEDGNRAPGLRFGDPRAMALLGALACFVHVVGGLTNKALCELMAALLAVPYSHRQATYDLRRLRRKGLIERVPGRNLYRVTRRGRALATFLTKLEARVVVPVLSELDALPNPCRPASRPIVSAWRSYERELDSLISDAHLAA